MGEGADRNEHALDGRVLAAQCRERLLGLPGVHYHDYGKSPRPGRKLGHCTLVAPTAATRDALLRRVLRLVPR